MDNFYDFYERYRDYIMCIILLILLIMGFVFGYKYFNNRINKVYDKIEYNKESKLKIFEIEQDKDKVYVDIKGEIKSPGVYSLDTDKRVVDAVKKAGGFTLDADSSITNLSKKLKDEMVIMIYSKKEVKKMSEIEARKQKAIERCNQNNSNNNACLKKDDVTIMNANKSKESKSTLKGKISGKVSINTADKEELMTLSGIGESKAENIIEYRKQNKFNDVSDIKKVKGIGDSIFEKIKDNITT